MIITDRIRLHSVLLPSQSENLGKLGKTWEHQEILLIEKWGDTNTQETGRNSVFLRAAGYADRDHKSCKTRINTLVNVYHLFPHQCHGGFGPPRVWTPGPNILAEFFQMCACIPTVFFHLASHSSVVVFGFWCFLSCLAHWHFPVCLQCVVNTASVWFVCGEAFIHVHKRTLHRRQLNFRRSVARDLPEMVPNSNVLKFIQTGWQPASNEHVS